jgi:hypothetical protein
LEIWINYWQVVDYMDMVISIMNDLQREYAQLAIENWLTDGLFTWTWWFLISATVIPWLIFFYLLDRSRALSIWLFGLMQILITTFTDDLGSELNIWVYPIKFVPVSLIAMPFDFSIIPVFFMLVYQYFKTWRTFSMALFGVSLIFSFVGEPLSVWVGAVSYHGWKYYHSFIFYIFSGMFARAFTQKWIIAER